MKPILSAIFSIVLASGLATGLSYGFGARGQTLAIIAVLTSVVSGTTAYLAATIAQARRGTKESQQSPLA